MRENVIQQSLHTLVVIIFSFLTNTSVTADISVL